MGLFNNKEEKWKKKLQKHRKKLKNCSKEKLTYKNTLDMAPTPILRIDENYNLKYINRAGADLIGKSLEKIEGKKCYNVFDWDICQKYRCPLKRTIRDEEEIEVKTRLESIEEKEIFLNCRGVPVRDDNGNTIGASVYLQDITERKRKEQDFETIVEKNDQPMIAIEENKEIVKVNESAKEYFEISEKEMIGSSLKETLRKIGIDHDKILRTIEKDEDNEMSFDLEKGRTKHFIPSSVVFDDNKNSTRRVLVFKDITDRKEIKEKLENQRNRQETLVENAPVSISITDLDDNLLYVNDYMADKFGYAKEEMEGKSLSELTTKEEFEKLQKKTKNRKDGESESYELKFFKKDGTPIEVLISAAPFKNDEGEVIKTAGFIQDITEIKKLQREQEETKRYLERQVEKILKAIEKVEEGDMTVSIEKEKDDHIGRLIDGFNNMLDEFRKNLREIQKAAEQLNNASESIASSSEELNAVSENVTESVEDITQKANRQADESEKLFERIEHSAANMEETSASAEDINDSSKQVAKQTEEGKKFAKEAVEGVKELQDVLDSTSEKVADLDRKSEKIGNVIDTISDIAEQTNLLALNAAIEAARAGEEGKGFAVVADSVRELAEETKEETDNIKEIIEETQSNTSNVVEGVGEVTDKAEKVRDVTQNNLHSLEEIKESIDLVSRSIHDISKSVEEVSDDLQDSSDRVESVMDLAEKNTDQAESVSASAEEQNSSVEELSSSAQQLSSLANDLNGLVDKYELK